MSSFKSRLRKKVDGIDEEALAIFRRYQWPGNVRELRNVIERAMILEDSDEITAKYLPRGLAVESRAIGTTLSTAHDTARLPEGGVSLEEVEMSLVRQALERSGGNQTKAAELLHISRDQLRYRMKKLEEVGVAANESE